MLCVVKVGMKFRQTLKSPLKQLRVWGPVLYRVWVVLVLGGVIGEDVGDFLVGWSGV